MCKSRFLASASKTPPGQGGTPPGQGGKPPGQGGGDTGGLAPPDVPGIAFYFHQDQLSSTAVLTDEYGEVHEHTGYFPDGATWYEKGPRRPINGYLFSGKPLDPDSGLYDFGQRFYDPDTSLWLGLDPAFTDKTGDAVGKPMMLASLAYAGQSPIRFIDPDGRLFWVPIIVGVGYALTSNANTANAPTSPSAPTAQREHGNADVASSAGKATAVLAAPLLGGGMMAAKNFVENGPGGSSEGAIMVMAGYVGSGAFNVVDDAAAAEFSVVKGGLDDVAGSEFLDDSLRMIEQPLSNSKSPPVPG